MPGDGNCLFHSLGKAFKKSHIEMRNTIIGFIERKPKYKISDARIKDWIKWENNLSWRKYVSYMLNQGTWGGALEIQLCSEIFRISLWSGQRAIIFNTLGLFSRRWDMMLDSVTLVSLQVVTASQLMYVYSHHSLSYGYGPCHVIYIIGH